MRLGKRQLLSAVMVAGIGLTCPTLTGRAADWPCYKADAARSSVTEEKLEFPLGLNWVYESPRPPCPAWPEPSREMHRIDFDYAFQPVAVNGLVYFGSSADDTIRALDMRTGKVRWRFTTGGPIRFAPHIANAKCYVASDDGFAYCLDAATGNLVWKFRAAPEDRQVIGNGRMISRWPCRSGVLVADGVVYVTAGIWPSEGVYVYSLDTETGRQLWCNDTSGSMHIVFPHEAYGLGGVVPQGYLLASDNVLLVPTGRSVPAGFERRSGRFLYRANHAGRPFSTDGGCWATIAGDRFYTPSHSKHEGAFSRTLGVSGPLKGDGLRSYSLATGVWGGWHQGYNLPNRHRVLVSAQMLYLLGSGKIEAFRYKNLVPVTPEKWVADHLRVYCVALADNALLVGGEGTITAFAEADGKQIWRGQVKGQVRGLAIASGRIIAATEDGRIHCFAPGKGEGSAAIVGLGTSPRKSGNAAEIGAASNIVSLIQRFNITKGYALVIGEPDARLAESVAEQTQLQVLSVLRDEDKVVSERTRLVEKERLYGSKVTVSHHERTTGLPYAPYFANVIVMCGDVAELSGKDLYRVLRPCGGLMCFVDASREDVETLFREADLPEGELSVDGESVVLLRGKLPGAFDWNSEVTTDQRVKWPLELSWFGGPGPARMFLHRDFLGKLSLSHPAPVVANGRYFGVGENHLIAMDAYNGCELWSRWLGGLYGFEHQGQVAADEDSVYVNFPDYCLQLEAQTGRIRKIHNESGALPSSPRFSLDEVQTFTPHAGPKYSGTASIQKTPDGLELALVTRTPEVTPRDSWDLYFDLRPASNRLLPYGPGVVQTTIAPADMSWRPGPMSWRPYPGQAPAHPEIVIRPKEVTDGVGVVVRISWEALRTFTGTVPKDFAFAATLNMYAGGTNVVEKHLFADGSANFLGHGWAVFTLDGSASRTTGADADVVPQGKWTDLPAYARTSGRAPRRNREDTYYYFRGLAQNVNRVNPLTGKGDGKLTYLRSYGCGGTVSSSTMDFFRSGTFGFYDLADDSGMRNFAGFRPGCGVSMVPALGMLISNEGASGCTCSYNFQTSLALAPAAKRSNEDWAVFNADLAATPVQQTALNLGAPGDRRDEEGILWFGIPQIEQRAMIVSGRRVPFFRMPFYTDYYDGFGPYRFNADRVTIKGTKRPWIYASGYRGLKSATLDLLYYAKDIGVRLSCRQPPEIDGDLADPCWDGSGRIQLHDKRADVYLREDADNLYIAYQQRAVIGRKGEREPWKADTEGDDAPVWEDDSFEMHLQTSQNSNNIRGIHLGVSASGARYDGMWVTMEEGSTGNKWDVEEDTRWNGTWSSAVKVDEDRFRVEMAVPWTTLSATGLKKEESLRINFGQGKLKLSRSSSWPLEEFDRLSYVVRPENMEAKPRAYTVRLHFAEPDNVVSGQRLFDIKLQGKTVLENLDIVGAVGDRNMALIREFKGVMGDKAITLELVPAAREITPLSMPIINGIEVVAEEEGTHRLAQ